MFQIHPLSQAPFAHLYGLSDAALKEHGAVAMIADTKPGYPCRVTLRDAEIGDRVILTNYAHQPAETPYKSAHAIFAIDGAVSEMPEPGAVPDAIKSRLISVRAFDHDHMMIAADLVEDEGVVSLISHLFDNPEADYIHLHYAVRGCFAASVTRV